MRVVLLAHGLAPLERTGVETYVASLAAALGRLGAEVLVFAPRRAQGAPHLAERCEPRPGYRVHWLELAAEAEPRNPRERFEPPGLGSAFGDFLERERPDIAHVHHLEKLGVGVLAELERRGIPALFTAHDHWSVCHRSTLLRPDLSRCETPGRVEACARCDRATAFLNSVPGLGDYHMGVLPDQLRPPERECLADLLSGPERGDGEAENGNGVLALRRELTRERRELLARFERVLAPSRLVAEHAIAGGALPERVIEAPYGIEREELGRIPAPRFERNRPLRFGYVGALTKHKGVHVLLEAFADRRSVAELAIWGSSTDEAYAARLADQALRAGAQMAGPFEHHRLPEVLSKIDVLCVPSLWDENAPFVVREAFAAGRPVLASSIGALHESVRDGVDGLLLPAGDVEAWRAAIDSLAAEPERGRDLALGVRVPPALDDTAVELMQLYRDVLEERAACGTGVGEEGSEDSSGLAHLAEFEQRRGEVVAEPLDALRARALYGVERLRTALRNADELGEEPPRSGFWPDAVDGELQDRARDGRREREWLQRLVDEGAAVRRELEAEAAWLRSIVGAGEEERAWRERREADDARAIGSLEAELRWLRGTLSARDEELTWLRDQAAARADELEWLRGVAADHAEAREHYRQLAGADRAGADRADKRIDQAEGDEPPSTLGGEVRS